MQQETRNTLERFSMIVRRSPEGICLIDRRHVVVFANPAWAGMHGYLSAGELIGRPLRIFHTDAQMKQEVYPFLEMVELIGRYDQRLGRRRTDRSEFTAQTTAFLVLDEEGAVVGYVLYADAETENSPRTEDENSLCETREHGT